MHMLLITLWKHYVIRRSSISSILLTISELVVPILAFLTVIYAKSYVGNFDKVYVNESTYLDPISKEDLLTRINVGDVNILFAPDTEFTSSLVREVQLKLNLYNEDIKPFPSEEKLIECYNDYEFEGTTIVILFKGIYHAAPHHLEYNIKIYENGVLWNTNKLFSQEFIYTPGIGSENYIEKGFAAVQVALDTSFIEIVTDSPFNTTLTFQEFPYPPYLNTDGVTTVFRHILPFITIICFIFICPVTLKRVVLEKSSGLKELLKISGVKSWMLWFGWFLNGIVLNIISVIFIAIILTSHVFQVNYPLIEHCCVSILTLFLILYCSATITFLFAFSTLFHRGTLAMVLGVLLWIISYIIFIGFVDNVDIMSGTVKSLFLLFPTVALYYGYNIISIFEMREKDITFSNLFESPTTSSDDISLGVVIVMLLIDTVLYFLITLYLDKIWSGPYGISKPWYFLLQKPFKLFRRNLVTEVSVSDDYLLPNREKSHLEPLLRMRDVVKIYDNNVAVDNLTIDIYKGTITSLLGENGAGKSTTMSMLTGLTKATYGDIYVGDYQINNNVEEARKKISICTQNDLLYDELTVMQHLILFGMLKGMSEKDASNQATELLQNTLKLYDKANVYACNLSGGMKRKLSLGIALMGNPEILILDEPTAGIDIEGRKEIRDLILTFKGKKTILVSTHFLEEAEHLSDYIAIMDSGRLLCYGSPMFLKNKYNVGYNCLINYDNDQKHQKIKEMLRSYHAVIEPDEKPKLIHCYLGKETKKEIPKLLKMLDEKNIKYKLSNITLEDVYLKVQNKEKSSSSADLQMWNLNAAIESKSTGSTGYLEKISTEWLLCGQFFHKRVIYFKKKILQYLALTLLFFMIVFLTLLLGESGYTDVSKDGAKIPLKLSSYGKSDVYYSTSGTNEETKVDQYYKNIIFSEDSRVTKVNNVPETIIEKGMENIAHYMKRMIIATEFTFDDDGQLDSVNCMHSNKALHGGPISTNVVMNTLLKYFAGEDYSISASNTPLRSRNQKKQALNQSEATNLFLWLTLLPIGPLLLVSVVLLLPTVEYSKSTRILEKLCGISSPLYWSLHFVFDYAYYLTIISVLCVCLMIPFHFLNEIEIVNLCIILCLYGLACIPFAYFFTYTKTVEGAYAKFLIIHIICAPIVTGILLVFEEVDYYSTTLAIFKYGSFLLDPHILLCYLLSKFSVKIITNHNWDIMPMEQKKFLCHEKPMPCCKPESQECARDRAYIEDNSIYLLFVTFVGCMIILMSYDRVFQEVSVQVSRLVEKWWKYSKDEVDGPPNDKSEEGLIEVTQHKNSEIISKRNVFSVSAISKTFFSLEGIRPKGVQAIKRLTFKVLKGQCFGLLGVNGAGKSTSFRILTNEIKQTEGKLERDDVNMGYCPQHNALLDDLTGRQLLTFYGNLRHKSQDLDETVNLLLEKFGLKAIADKPCGTYSGGNKRKLSTCISVIGFPTWILLDEPTSGVDPVSRRELWDLIEQIKLRQESGIILTSHSMDECEALCDVLCILKDGNVKEKASVKELKEKYCVGHTLKVKFKISDEKENSSKQSGNKENRIHECTNENKFEELLYRIFGQEKINILGIENGIMHIRFFNSNWSAIFEVMENEQIINDHHIEDYWVKEASLEEVFMQIAKEEPKKESNKSQNNTYPITKSKSSSTDAKRTSTHSV